MISKALQLVFFWRRNHLPSIAFKCAFWGLIAWLAVGMFTNVRLALIAAAVIAGMCAIKYGLKNRKQHQKLLQMCDGDPVKLAALKTKLNTPGMAGTLMREMLNAEIDDDDDEWDDEDAEPLSEQELQANIKASEMLIKKMSVLVTENALATPEHCKEAESELLSAYSSGEARIDIDELVSEFLPDNAMNICLEDFINEDDHASLVEEFAAATNGRWEIENCTSSYDEDAERWVVTFSESGSNKTWRFAQQGDWLSEKFLQQVISYTESKSGYTITVLDTEDFVSLVCLPAGMVDALNGSAIVQAA